MLRGLLFPRVVRVMVEVINKIQKGIRFNFTTNLSFPKKTYLSTVNQRTIYSDHIENARVSFADLDGNGTINPNTEILQSQSYYPFGLTHSGLQSPQVGVENLYKFNGTEEIEEIGWNHTLFRTFDPSIGRWGQIDPKGTERESHYVGMANNPIRYFDNLGDTIRVSGTRQAQTEFQTEVFEGSGGFYHANIDSNGNLTLESSGLEKEMDGMAEMSDKQQAFISEVQGVIESDVLTEIEVVTADTGVDVGNLKENKIDMADIAQFDESGSGGATSAGALVHEIVEQHEKAKAGVPKGIQPKNVAAFKMHMIGIVAESRVNGNIRQENIGQPPIFLEKDGTKIKQSVVGQPSGVIKITKTKIQ